MRSPVKGGLLAEAAGAFKAKVSESPVSANGSKFDRILTSEFLKRPEFVIYVIHLVEINQCPGLHLGPQIV
jgi:hypothetical protein